MKNIKIELSDFGFEFLGKGHYRVTYTSPVTGKQWCNVTTDMPLIDATLNEDCPKRCDLVDLKKICKR